MLSDPASELESEVVGAGKEWLGLGEEERRDALGPMPEGFLGVIRDAEAATKELHEAHIERLRAEMRTGDPEPAGGRARLVDAVSKPEVRFFLRVWIPCWLEYGKAPVQIFGRRGKGGRPR